MTSLRSILFRLTGPLLALVISFAVGGLFILMIGRDPVLVYERFFTGALGSAYGIGQVLFKATPLMFTGLSAAVAFRAGLFNIGAEGQLAIGALLTGIVPGLMPGLPPLLIIPAAVGAGMAGGALWGAVPGYLKARFGAHEVINTIMMNFVAAGIVNYFVLNVFAVPATVHTPVIPPAAELPRFGDFAEMFRGSPVNFSLLIAAGCSVLGWYFFRNTRPGYELRVLGANLPAAEYGGIRTGSRTVLAMAIAGAAAGLVGSNFVLGYKHYFELGFSEGIGFIGIAVALLARNNPIWIMVTALLFGTLEYGSLTINTMVPKELSNILQAIIILFMLVTNKAVNRYLAAGSPPAERKTGA